MSVKDGLPSTDFSRMNRKYIRNVAEGETVPDGLPATDFSRMNREYIKAVVEEAGGGGGGGSGGDFSTAEITLIYSVEGSEEQMTVCGIENVGFMYPEGAEANQYMTNWILATENKVQVLMYKGTGYCGGMIGAIGQEAYSSDNGGLAEEPVTSGGISITPDGTIVITGDGTLTAVFASH